ncbi:hypothetical protein L0Y65_00825 [Candidatus Micrarchaeota archaeon]|nr:hypothetical protein [Candidatus Micrarchaeota archaeon]
MKIRQETHEERGQSGKKGRFSRFKDAFERQMKVAKVAAAAFAVTFAVSCSDDTTGRDGGTQDGGPTDADTDHDSGPDGGPASPCTQYGPGDAHRTVFALEDEASPTGGTYFMRFTGIAGTGAGRVATFTLYPASMVTSEGVSFNNTHPTFTKNFPGVGNVTMELCEMTANPCTPSTGDSACTATLASSNGW